MYISQRKAFLHSVKLHLCLARNQSQAYVNVTASSESKSVGVGESVR